MLLNINRDHDFVLSDNKHVRDSTPTCRTVSIGLYEGCDSGTSRGR